MQTFLRENMLAIFTACLLVNLAVFLLYGIDKRKARKERWRISEKALMIAAVFGIIGAICGVRFFHHKTRKPLFRIGLPAILLLEAAAVGYFLYRVFLYH